MNETVGRVMKAVSDAQSDQEATRTVLSYAHMLYKDEIEPVPICGLLAASQNDGGSVRTTTSLIAALAMIGVLEWDFSRSDEHGHPFIGPGPLLDQSIDHLLSVDKIIFPSAVHAVEDGDADEVANLIRQVVSQVDPAAEVDMCDNRVSEENEDAENFQPFPFLGSDPTNGEFH